MQTSPHFTPTQNEFTHGAPFQKNLTTSLPTNNINAMYFNAPNPGVHSTTSSGTTTPVSDRSSVGTQSSASSVSGRSGKNRSSLRPSLKSSPTWESNSERKSSPPSVRFAEPEQPTRPKSLAPRYHQRKSHSYSNAVPNPLLQYQHRPASMMPSSASSRVSNGPQAYPTLPPHIVPTSHQGHLQYKKARSSQRFSAPVPPPQFGPKRQSTRPSADFSSPSLALEHRVSSFQSVSSVRSAPAELQTTLSLPAALPGPYDPLEHYVPCLYEGCTSHFSPTSLGSTYYIAQGPYSLSKHHGYCPQHASKEVREANAWCKRNWESLRQNAGRKTLGQIASEFDIFLETFRRNRRGEDVELLQRQGKIVVGGEANQNAEGKENEWSWKYTPRHCTRASCPSARYSPFANHLFAFYNTRRSSTFSPLPTFCPSCARNEVEAFERMVSEKWASRTGWDEREWGMWFGRVVEEREGGKVFWEGAQEREVREWMVGKGQGAGIKKEKAEKAKVEGMSEEIGVGKKKSVFRRLFGGKGGE